MKNIILLIIATLFLISCNQPNPHPETLDPIYNDLEKELKDVAGAIAAEEKQRAEFKTALNDVKPQTGQIKYAQKRLYESEARLDKLTQRKSYLELRVESRKAVASHDYNVAFQKKADWPDPKEYQTYLSQKALENAPKTWSSKGRMERFAAPPKKAEPAEGGHH